MSIGPRCTKCKKQKHHHDAKTLYCPTGKRHRDLGYTTFNLHQKFEAKPPSKGGASEGRKDREVRRSVKSNPCCACGTKGTDWNPVDPAHVRSFGVTQQDHPSGMVPLCRQCHRIQHAEGWGVFISMYPVVAEVLAELGWEVIRDPFSSTRVALRHPEIA